MSARSELIELFRFPHGSKGRLADYDPGWAGDSDVPRSQRKQKAESLLSEDVSRLAAAQELLWASDTHSVLVVFQAMDAAGKDGTIKHVLSGVNPQGCSVSSFKQPSSEELDHNFLWRYMKAVPQRGLIGIFNRSYYEEVLVVRVHPEWIARQRIPNVDVGHLDESFWKQRYEDINAFERHLACNGTLVLKFFLNVSKDEQRKRFLKRIRESEKHWKYSAADLIERGYWDQYQDAYQSLLRATSTSYAPWYVVPADHKWVTRAVVAATIAQEIERLDLSYPAVTQAQREALEAGLKALEAEGD